MSDRILQRSQKAIQTQIIGTGIAVVALCVLVSIIFAAFIPMRTRDRKSVV